MTNNYIAGEWLPPAETSPNINPSNTNDVVGEYARASAAETERAITAAYDAFPAWSRSTVQTRHDILRRLGTRCTLARRISAVCSPARRASPWQKASARSRVQDKSSNSSLASASGWRAKSCHQYGRPSMWRSPASRSASSGSSLPGTFRLQFQPGRSRQRQHRCVQACRARSWFGSCARRDHRPRRSTGRCIQPGHGPGLSDWCGDAEQFEGFCHLLYGLSADGAQDRPGQHHF